MNGEDTRALVFTLHILPDALAVARRGRSMTRALRVWGAGDRTADPVCMPPANPQEFFYDLNGNLTDDGWRAYLWSEENRLIAIDTASGAGVPPAAHRRSEFVYDGQGRRAERTDYSGWNGSAYATTNTTRYVWDGWLLLAELDEGGSIKKYNVHGLDLSESLQGAGGIGGLLCVVDQGTNYLFTFDGNGNVTDVLEADGALAAHYEYDPFGRTVAASGAYAVENRWRFSTKQVERAWGLYYYGYRYYSPEMGRWLSRDPVQSFVAEDVFCEYRFVGGNPVGLTDYLGLITQLGIRWPGAVSLGLCGAFQTSHYFTGLEKSDIGKWIVQRVRVVAKIVEEGTVVGGECKCCRKVEQEWTLEFYEALQISADWESGAPQLLDVTTYEIINHCKDGTAMVEKMAAYFGDMETYSAIVRGPIQTRARVCPKEFRYNPKRSACTRRDPPADWSWKTKVPGRAFTYSFQGAFDCCPIDQQTKGVSLGGSVGTL